MPWEVDTASAKRMNEIADAVKNVRRPVSRDRPGSRRRSDFLACSRHAEEEEGHRRQAGQARRLQRHHQEGRARRDGRSARYRCAAGRRLSRPPRARLPRRLQPFAGALAQAARRAFGRPRPVGGAAPRLRPRKRDRALHLRGILEHLGAAEDAARRRVRGEAGFADGKRLQPRAIGNGEDAGRLKAVLEGASYVVDIVEAKPVKRNPGPPFTTSTLQQAASSKLGFSASRTMQVAQKLYEGFDIGGETVGLITYMRTDGVQMAPEAIDAARSAIGDQFGERLPAGKAALLFDQGEERPGSARGDPPDRFQPHARQRAQISSMPTRSGSTS